MTPWPFWNERRVLSVPYISSRGVRDPKNLWYATFTSDFTTLHRILLNFFQAGQLVLNVTATFIAAPTYLPPAANPPACCLPACLLPGA